MMDSVCMMDPVCMLSRNRSVLQSSLPRSVLVSVHDVAGRCPGCRNRPWLLGYREAVSSSFSIWRCPLTCKGILGRCHHLLAIRQDRPQPGVKFDAKVSATQCRFRPSHTPSLTWVEPAPSTIPGCSWPRLCRRRCCCCCCCCCGVMGGPALAGAPGNSSFNLAYRGLTDGRCGGGVMMAGGGGGAAPDFFDRSATVARYARFACSRLMQSMYSELGFAAACGAPDGFDLGVSGAFSADEPGDPPLASCVGEACCDCDAGWLEVMPALPAAWRWTTSCRRAELISSNTVTRARSLATWADTAGCGVVGVCGWLCA
jgi:hypothetical protein